MHDCLGKPNAFSLKCNNSWKRGLQRHLRHIACRGPSKAISVMFGGVFDLDKVGGATVVQSPPERDPFCGSAGLQLAGAKPLLLL